MTETTSAQTGDDPGNPAIPPPPVAQIPPLPPSAKKALRGFSADQVKSARATLTTLATSCADYRTRREAAEYIDKVARIDDAEFFTGDGEKLKALALLPSEQQSAAALQLFAEQEITRTDLDMILKSVASEQASKIAALEHDKSTLERRNRMLELEMLNGKTIDGAETDARE